MLCSKKWFWVFLFLAGRPFLFAQENLDSLPQTRHQLFGLPLVYYTPETRWAFGLAGVVTTNWKHRTPRQRPSQLQVGGAYTLNKQLLLYLSYQLFLRDNHWQSYGELGYYRYNYFYFGIGNEFADYEGELFGVNFLRLRLNGLYQIAPKVFLGLRYQLDDYQLTEFAEGGLLEQETSLEEESGLVSGLGVLAQYDSRDQIFYPRQGYFAEGLLLSNGSWLGSPFEYQKLIFDVRSYHPIGKNTILASNIYGEFTRGEAPFYQLALLGGTKRMRGYYEGRFRDQHLILAQTEYRFPLFWRIKATIFAGYGGVAPTLRAFNLSDFRYTIGGGLRVLINREDQLHIRIDAGFGKNTSGYYLTIGEAF